MNQETREVPSISQAQLDRLLSVAPDHETFEREANANSAIRAMRDLGQVEVIRNPPAAYGYRIILDIEDIQGCVHYAEQCHASLSALERDVRTKAEEALREAEIEREKIRRQIEWEERRRGFLPATLESINALLMAKHGCRINSFAFLRYPRKRGSFDLEFPEAGVTIIECAYYIDKNGTPLVAGPSVPNDQGWWTVFAHFATGLSEDIGSMLAVAIAEAERLASIEA